MSVGDLICDEVSVRKLCEFECVHSEGLYNKEIVRRMYEEYDTNMDICLEDEDASAEECNALGDVWGEEINGFIWDQNEFWQYWGEGEYPWDIEYRIYGTVGQETEGTGILDWLENLFQGQIN